MPPLCESSDDDARPPRRQRKTDKSRQRQTTSDRSIASPLGTQAKGPQKPRRRKQRKKQDRRSTTDEGHDERHHMTTRSQVAWLKKQSYSVRQQLTEDLAAVCSDVQFGIDFVECCCSEDSELTTRMEKHGKTAERWGLHNYDLSTRLGYEAAALRL